MGTACPTCVLLRSPDSYARGEGPGTALFRQNSLPQGGSKSLQSSHKHRTAARSEKTRGGRCWVKSKKQA